MTRAKQRISNSKMRALEEFIRVSKDGTYFGKQGIIYILRKSRNLSREVVIRVLGIPGKDIGQSVHDMNSSNGSTRVDLFFKGMGSGMRLAFTNYPDHSIIRLTCDRRIITEEDVSTEEINVIDISHDLFHKGV